MSPYGLDHRRGMDVDFRKNYFELLGLPLEFQLDAALLERHYRELQAQVHPDRFTHAGDAERRLSMQWSTYVNEAYQTLKHSLSRARYVLQMNGVDTAEESNTAMPAEFLMRQMEWREGIMEARAAQDAEALEHQAAKLRSEQREMADRLTRLLDTEKNFSLAAELVRMLKFMEKLGEDINHALEALEAR